MSHGSFMNFSIFLRVKRPGRSPWIPKRRQGLLQLPVLGREPAPPRDDDTYSPLHAQPSSTPGSIDLDTDGSVDEDEERDEFDVEPDFDESSIAGEAPVNDVSNEDDDLFRRLRHVRLELELHASRVRALFHAEHVRDHLHRVRPSVLGVHMKRGGRVGEARRELS